VVTVTGTFGVRDWSGDVDDDYEGNMQFVFVSELEPLTVPSNLSITGIEHNQAIQFFRSTLDPATIQGKIRKIRSDLTLGMRRNAFGPGFGSTPTRFTGLLQRFH
jgi:hypothetical protein